MVAKYLAVKIQGVTHPQKLKFYQLMSLPRNVSVTFPRLLKKRLKRIRKKTPKPAQQQLDMYLEDVQTIPEHVDPLLFWIEHESIYPCLASVAVDVLTIPLSSAPVERIFSMAGEFTIGKRNRLANAHLEHKVLLCKNNDYLNV